MVVARSAVERLQMERMEVMVVRVQVRVGKVDWIRVPFE